MDSVGRRGFLGALVAGGLAAKAMAARLLSGASGGGAAQNAPAAFRVESAGLAIELSSQGEIVGALLGKKGPRWPVRGRTALLGCRAQGTPQAERLEGGGVRFTKKLAGEVGGTPREVTLTESFLPAKDSVRWEMRLESPGSPWSTPIETHLEFGGAAEKKFWLPWGGPSPDESWKMSADPELYERIWDEVSKAKDPGWEDPFTFTGFAERTFWYGAPYFQYDNPKRGMEPIYRAAFCFPLATVADRVQGTAFTAALSPEDVLLDMTLETSAAGGVKFSRLFRRLAGPSPVHFSLDLLAHEADWRGGVRWMSERYPEFFRPPLAQAQELGGTGAYSSYEGELDVEKLKRMAFTVNWKASFDFPYQGLFMPPVPDGEPWPRRTPFGEAPRCFLGIDNSVPQMAAYSRRMRRDGFYVLNYFDAAELGENIIYPKQPFRRPASDPDFWKDANDFLYGRMEDALLLHSEKEPLALRAHRGNQKEPGIVRYGWGVGMDCGEASYQDHLLDQARKLIEKIPESSGMCIDRLDYFRLYNFRRDDGVTWYDGPARALVNSWKEFSEKLGRIQHDAGQALFVNNHVKRLDTLRHVDGLFDEHSALGTSKNLTALLGMFKPVIAWVREEDKFKPDPDTFMQRFLYLGMFPMAPYPQNDHSLLPSEQAEKVYTDYGPMLLAMRGREWVLLPHAIEVERGPAKANLFRTPQGYLAPVVLGGAAATAAVVLRSLPELAAGRQLRGEVLHPGGTGWKELSLRRQASALRVQVPLQRGCAMLRLRA